MIIRCAWRLYNRLTPNNWHFQEWLTFCPNTIRSTINLKIRPDKTPFILRSNSTTIAYSSALALRKLHPFVQPFFYWIRTVNVFLSLFPGSVATVESITLKVTYWCCITSRSLVTVYWTNLLKLLFWNACEVSFTFPAKPLRFCRSNQHPTCQIFWINPKTISWITTSDCPKYFVNVTLISTKFCRINQ